MRQETLPSQQPQPTKHFRQRVPAQSDPIQSNHEKEVKPELSEENIDVHVLDGDEALRLVGSRREEVFDAEYNAKLRKKLDRYIPTICAAVYFTQFLDKNTLSYAR